MYFQYSVFFIVPLAYIFENFESFCMAKHAAESCVIGCVSSGSARNASKTFFLLLLASFIAHSFANFSALSIKSTLNASTSPSVGTLFVNSKNKSASGIGSRSRFPGNFSCNSGIVNPRKRIPSFASNREVS